MGAVVWGNIFKNDARVRNGPAWRVDVKWIDRIPPVETPEGCKNGTICLVSD